MKPPFESEKHALSDLFHAASKVLLVDVAAEGPVRDLLAHLDYLNGTAAQESSRAALLRNAAMFHRIFSLESPDAPGLVALGAEVDPASAGGPPGPPGSVSGTGVTFQRAFEACVGEGVEYVSQFATPADTTMHVTADEALAAASPGLRTLWASLRPHRRNTDVARTAWVAAADLGDGGPVWLPADICLRRPGEQREISVPWPLSTGCGAGPDHLAATLHGLLELIERDAVALWWRGGVRGHLVPHGVGASLLTRLRGDAIGRRTWLLDITSDIGVPVVVAASCGDDGYGLSCGSAARPTLTRAAEAALMEMAQMELAFRITEAKREVRGDSALNDVDQHHIRRFTSVSVRDTPALHPLAPPAAARDLPADDNLALLAALRGRLDSAGLTPCALNLTRAALGVPVVRVVCPGLEMGMTSEPGPRLAAAAARTGADPLRVPPL